MKLFFFLALISALSSATTVRIYKGKGCGGNHGACRNAGQRDCCRYPNSSKFKSASFSSIPGNTITGIWSKTVCRGKITGVGKAGGCVNGVGKSAAWVKRNGRTLAARSNDMAEGELHQCENELIADAAVIGERSFNMGEGVPAEDVEKLEMLIENDNTEVPADLLKYEL